MLQLPASEPNTYGRWSVIYYISFYRLVPCFKFIACKENTAKDEQAETWAAAAAAKVLMDKF